MSGVAVLITGAPGAGKSTVLEAGRDTFVVTATTETEAELQATLDAIGAARSLVVALAVSPDTAATRVAAREPDWWDGKAPLVAHARELAASIPALPGVGVVVSNEGRDARATAVAIVDELAARGLTK